MIHNGPWLWDSSKPPIVGMLKEKRKVHGTSYGLSEAGYDIRLKQDIIFTPNKWWEFWKKPEIVVSTPYVFDRFNHQESGYFSVKEKGRFTLASAIEEFDMPESLVAVVHDKSTWARQGVSVFNTVIEPGWKGFLTLEIVFHGNKPVHIPAGSGIAQVLFHRLGNLASYAGKYQNQEDRPIPSIFEPSGEDTP